jgi:hypothetical protein
MTKRMPANPNSLKELYKKLHVGAENELAGTCLVLWDTNQNDFIVPPYGVNIAVTEAGELNLPKMSLQPDGVNPINKTARVEHVGGARLTTDQKFEADLTEACRILVKVLTDPQTFNTASKVTLGTKIVTPLSKVIQLYKNRLPPKLARFKLKEVPFPHAIWYVEQSKQVEPIPQLNFEVPFRNLGHIPQSAEEEKSDFAQAFEDPWSVSQKEVFQTCRAKANQLVDKKFRPIAAYYYAGLYKAESIKLAKMRSLFTLYYYIRSIEQLKNEGKVQKDSYVLLPKVGVNDLIRNVLNERDKAILAYITTDTHCFIRLKQQMNEDILECAQRKRSNLTKVHDSINAVHDAVFKPISKHPRYCTETDKSYGMFVKSTAPKPNNDENRYPASSLHCRADTPTFKPMQPLIYSYEKNPDAIGLEPVIVFETRHKNHPYSKLGRSSMLLEALLASEKKELQKTRESIRDVQKPFTDRPPKS